MTGEIRTKTALDYEKQRVSWQVDRIIEDRITLS
jgi:hypothetical protein